MNIKIIDKIGEVIDICNYKNVFDIYNKYKNIDGVTILFEVYNYYNIFKENILDIKNVILEIDTQELVIVNRLEITFEELVYNLEFLKFKVGIKYVHYFNNAFLVKFKNGVCYNITINLEG